MNNSQDKINEALSLIGITKEQYFRIIERWNNFDMMDIPNPFIFGAEDPYFRAWTTACLNDTRGREELEKILGPDVLPDFSTYTPVSPPFYQNHPIWKTTKLFL